MARTTEDEIRNGLSGLSGEEVQSEHMNDMMAQVKLAGTGSTGGKRVLLGSVGGLLTVTVLFLALLLIPVTYNQQVGCLVSVAGSTEWLEGTDFSALDRELPELMNINTTIADDEFTMDLAFRDLEAPEALVQLQAALAEMEADMIALKFSSEDVYVEVGGNALAAITQGTISIGAAGLTDNEIERAIVDALAAHGIPGSSAVVTTTQEGDEMHRQIEITIPEGNEGTHTIEVGP
jgi:hypothetical protein